MKSALLKLIRNGLGQLIIFVDYLTKPKPMRRSDHLQRMVDQQVEALALYQFKACPFCVKVRRSMTRLNLNIDVRDAANNEAHRQELISQGGRLKVPCLRTQDGDSVKWLYESNDIIAYLDNRFGVETRMG